MSETLIIPEGSKEEIYLSLVRQIRSILSGEEDLMADMANVSACLKETFGFLWVGFYRAVTEDNRRELVLGPFQGPLACTRIAYGKGVCGTAWKQGETLIVPDVELFPGHIACSSRSRSEIVVPISAEGRVVAVLDIDSEEPGTFDETDRKYLEQIAGILVRSVWK